MNQFNLSVCKANPEDYLVFAKIKAAAYADDREKTKPEPDQIPVWYNGSWYVGLGIVDEEEAKRLLTQMSCHFILLDDQPIGIVWLHVEEADSLTIEDFCILPEYQGRGYGKKALPMLENLYSENKRWLLSTPAYCTRNRHLYESLGYQQTGTCSEGTVILYEKCLK